MAPKKIAVIGTLAGSALFGILWKELFTYARGLFYDWILKKALDRFNPDDPRVRAAAELLALWGPIIAVAVILWCALWWSNTRHRARFTASAQLPALPPAQSEAERNASYLEALKGRPSRPLPDMPLGELVERIYEMKGPLPPMGSERRRYLDEVSNEILRGVIFNDLHVWAGEGSYRFDPISKDILKRAWSLHESNALSYLPPPDGVKRVVLTGLELNRREEDRIWPPYSGPQG